MLQIDNLQATVADKSILKGLSAVGLVFALSGQPVFAQQANIPVLAQAVDRCMTTHAVRLTKTAATDEEIHAQAAQACLSLEAQLNAAIKAQLPPPQATELLGKLREQAKPNFMAMVARIRSDRERGQ